jgi:hypothetical protein
VPYFTTAELRALPDMDDAARFPDERLEAAHDWIVAVIERECETTFIAENVTETLNGSGGPAQFLSSAYVQSVTSGTVDGVSLTAPELAGILIEHGVLYHSNGAHWSSTTRGNVVITYVAGYSTTPPADLKEAAMRGARNWLMTNDAWSGADSRATSITNDYGNIALSVASADGRPTGWPDVDATITAWARRVRIPKVS